jgi:hypothetical protein
VGRACFANDVLNVHLRKVQVRTFGVRSFTFNATASWRRHRRSASTTSTPSPSTASTSTTSSSTISNHPSFTTVTRTIACTGMTTAYGTTSPIAVQKRA